DCTAPAMFNGLLNVPGALFWRREPRLAAQIREFVHPVRIEDGILEFRPEPDSPRDLAPRLAAFLAEATGRRWTVALSAERGGETLAGTERARHLARRAEAERHPLVRAILEAFPGATIAAIRPPEPGAPTPAGGTGHETDLIYDDGTEHEDET
ncbi:MAG: DNA polymerase III subunit gamma/tau, partial [Acetobacteraceae bacterium]